MPWALGHQLVPKHDLLLRKQRDGAEGPAEVMVVNVRRDAVNLHAHMQDTLGTMLFASPVLARVSIRL